MSYPKDIHDDLYSVLHRSRLAEMARGMTLLILGGSVVAWVKYTDVDGEVVGSKITRKRAKPFVATTNLEALRMLLSCC